MSTAIEQPSSSRRFGRLRNRSSRLMNLLLQQCSFGSNPLDAFIIGNPVRKVCFLLAVFLLLLFGPGPGTASQPDPIYAHVDAIRVSVYVKGTKEVTDSIDTQHLVDTSQSYILDRIQKQIPTIQVGEGSGLSTEDREANRQRTLFTSIYVTVESWFDQESETVRLIGSIGVRLLRPVNAELRREDHEVPLRHYPMRLFLSANETQALSAALEDAIASQLALVLIEPLLVYPEIYHPGLR